MHEEHSILVSSHGDYEKTLLHYLDHSTCVYTQVRRWLRISGAEARLFGLSRLLCAWGTPFLPFCSPLHSFHQIFA